MILSMTGFAAESAELPGVSLAVELRSVNHRYLDVTVKLPDELRALESALRERIAAELKRGKVECRVALSRGRRPAPRRSPSIAARVAQLAAAAAAVRNAGPDAAPLSVAEILRWPGVLAEPTVPPDELAAQAHALVDEALAELAASRAREGAKLAAMLRPAAPTSRRRSRVSRRASRRSMRRTSRSSARACAKRASTPTRTG